MSGPPLRRDLQVLPLSGDRDYVVVDDIGGRFARVKRAVWEQLRSSTPEDGRSVLRTQSEVHERNRLGEPSDNPDAVLWQQAAAAGWTNTRPASSTTGPGSPLSIRIPIASLDPVARRVMRWSDCVFSPTAILFWSVAAVLGVMMLVVRWEHWRGSIPSLSAYLRTLQPLSIVAVFVITKSIHELGHAVACRRLGSRVGVAGVWFLCFMPCPYVDVTEVWRQRNPMRRAAVMAAGMVVEGVLCVIAIWVWVLADSAEVRLAAMNVVLICGVSTVLFNANPLMRYDGYFILSDLADSTNLREEARRAWQRVLVEPCSRWSRWGGRVWAMIGYHIAAAVYRVTLVIAIATMLLAMADRYGAWRIVAVLLFSIAGMMLFRKIKGGWAMWSGSGKWSVVSAVRRRMLMIMTLLVIVAALLIPTPRYRHVEGRFRAADTRAVYLPGEGTLAEVHVRVGDRVSQNGRLAKLSDRELMMEMESTSGQARVLEHRSRVARLASLQTGYRTSNSNRRTSSPGGASGGLQNDAPERQWDVLDAATRAIATTQTELNQRRERLDVRSPVDGLVLSADESPGNESAVGDLAGESKSRSRDASVLSPNVGQPSSDVSAWCRIATTNRMQVALPIDAADHREVQVGCPIRFTIPGRGPQVVRSRVVSVSPLHDQGPVKGVSSDGKTHGYQALCEVPAEIDLPIEALPRWDGAACVVVVHLPSRALWQDAWEMAREVLF